MPSRDIEPPCFCAPGIFGFGVKRYAMPVRVKLIARLVRTTVVALFALTAATDTAAAPAAIA